MSDFKREPFIGILLYAVHILHRLVSLRLFNSGQPVLAYACSATNAPIPKWGNAFDLIKSAMVDISVGGVKQLKSDAVGYGVSSFTEADSVKVTAPANNDETREGRPDKGKEYQIWVDAVTEQHLKDLAEAIEAVSISELVRRALRARESWHPEESDLSEVIVRLKKGRDNSRRITVTLPSTSVERVERLKKATEKDFRTLVYEAILILAELYERSKEENINGPLLY